MTIAFAAEAPDVTAPIVWSRQLPSQMALKEELIAAICHQLTSPGWVAPEDEPWLKLGLEEMVTNAMVHGNEADPF